MQFSHAIVAAILSYTAVAVPTYSATTESCSGGKCVSQNYGSDSDVLVSASAVAQATLNSDGYYCMPKGWTPSKETSYYKGYKGSKGSSDVSASASASATVDKRDWDSFHRNGRNGGDNNNRGHNNNNNNNGHGSGTSTAPIGIASASATGSGPGESASASGSVTETGGQCNGYSMTFTITAEAESEVTVPLNGQPVSVDASAIAAVNVPAAIAGKGQCKVDSTSAIDTSGYEVVREGWRREVEATADAVASATITCKC